MYKNILIGLLSGILSTGIIFSAQANSIRLEQTIQALEQEKNVGNIYQAYFPNEEIARKTAITFHSQLIESNIAQGFLILELTDDEKQQLKSFGYKFKPATDYIQRRNQRLETLQQNFTRQLSESLSEQNQQVGIQAIPGYSCYETVEETFSAAQAMATNNPSLAEWIDVGDSWEKTQGIGGYDINVLKLTNTNIIGDKPILFINSAIHAREYTTAPLNLEFARWLLDGYGVNPDATWLLDHHQIHLMLQTNPDGRKQAESGILWRKNTNQNYCGATSNSRGADLNRNFSFFWNATNGQGSSGNQCNATYRGSFAGSEPETQAIENYVRSIFPDNRGPNIGDAAPDTTTGMHIDIHSYSELVLWPWGSTAQTAPNGLAMQTLGRKFAFFNGYFPQQSIGLYPTDGTSDNVSYGELGVPAFTFELGTSFFQSCSVYQNSVIPDNLPALIYAAKVVRAPYVTPGGPDIENLNINGNSTSATIAPGGTGTLNATGIDTRFSAANGSEVSQNIIAAEYYIDTPPWVTGATAVALSATDGNFNNTSEGVTGSISTAGLSNGQHIVYVRAKDSSGIWGAFSAIFINISDVIPPNESELFNGIAKNNLSGAQNEETHYFMQVPDNAVSLSFDLSGGTGDADLYVRYGSAPTQSSWDCRPYRSGNQENCTISNIQPGTYYVMLRGYSAYSGTSLVGNYTIGSVGESFENINDVNIPDNNSIGVTSSLAVSRQGASGNIQVEVDIVHTYIGDLIVDLIAPDGSVFNLHNRSGGSSNNINQSYNISAGTTESQGTWQLRVRDLASLDVGFIDRFKIIFP